jgi:tRNA pseudouridine38-40 synthase
MRNIVLKLAYDGTHLHGSQWQRSGRTVQGEVEQAWTRLTQEHRRFGFSGRTDAGVHAQGQVAHVHTETRHPTTTIQRALNALLPDDIAVLETWEADLTFHARFRAKWRWYRYCIATATVLLPPLRHYVVHMPYPLDVAAMHNGLQALRGQHNFAAFTTAKHQGSTERVCYYAACGSIYWADQPLIAIDLVANGFLQHMVRMIVGSLVLVGNGKKSPEAFEQILHRQDRQQAGATAAAHGLTLMAVGYSGESYENVFTEKV